MEAQHAPLEDAGCSNSSRRIRAAPIGSSRAVFSDVAREQSKSGPEGDFPSEALINIIESSFETMKVHSTAHLDSSLTNSGVVASHIQSYVDAHFESEELQSSNVLIVEREEDDFECPECWKQMDTQQSIVQRLTAFARHMFNFEQRYLPQDLAKSRTGDVPKEENLEDSIKVQGVASTKVRGENSEVKEAMENFKGCEWTERFGNDKNSHQIIMMIIMMMQMYLIAMQATCRSVEVFTFAEDNDLKKTSMNQKHPQAKLKLKRSITINKCQFIHCPAQKTN